MTADNFTELLRALQTRKPFQVFTVELHGGKRFEIDHGNALVARDGVAVFVAPGGTPVWFDHDSVLRIVEATADVDA